MWSSNALMPFDPLIGTPATLWLSCTTPIGVVVVLINSENKWQAIHAKVDPLENV